MEHSSMAPVPRAEGAGQATPLPHVLWDLLLPFQTWKASNCAPGTPSVPSPRQPQHLGFWGWVKKLPIWKGRSKTVLENSLTLVPSLFQIHSSLCLLRLNNRAILEKDRIERGKMKSKAVSWPKRLNASRFHSALFLLKIKGKGERYLSLGCRSCPLAAGLALVL